MKKSLLALAAAGAFAGAAQAQSSVTVYGILDVGFVGASAKANGNTNAGTTSANVGPGNTAPNGTGAISSAAVNTSSFGESAETTSRLGFRGNEDLGGGLGAFFTIESAVSVNGQNNFSWGAASNRLAFVGLSKKGVGQFAIGEQYTVVHNAAAATDPGQLNNMPGNVIYDKMAAFGNTQAGQANGTATSNYYTQYSQFFGQGNNSSYTVRSGNMLTLKTAPMAGFVGNAFYMTTGSNASQTGQVGQGAVTGGQNSNNGWGLGVDYTWQKLLATANYQSFKSVGPSNLGANGVIAAGTPAVGATTTVPGFGGASQLGITNTNDTQQYYALTYDFGILKAYAQYINRTITSTLSANNDYNRSAQQIGVRSFITPKIESWLSGGTGKVSFGNLVNTAQGNTPTANFVGWQLGTNYWLSKRTNLYGIYGQQGQNMRSVATTTGGNAVANAANYGPVSYNASSYALGVRHTF